MKQIRRTYIWKASFYRKVIQCAFPSCLFLKSFSKNVYILKTSRFFSYLKPLNHLHSICTHFLVVDQCGAPILRCGLHKNIMDCFIPPDFFAISSWKMSLLFSGHRCRTEQGIMSNGICLIFLQFKYYLKLDPPPSYLTSVNGQWFALNIEMHLWEKFNTV